jgi:hypothetical protein
VNLSRQCCCDGGGGGTESPDCSVLPTAVSIQWTGDATLTYVTCGCFIADFWWKGAVGSVPIDGFTGTSTLVGAGTKSCFYPGISDAVSGSLFFAGCAEDYEDFSVSVTGTTTCSIGWDPTLLRWVAQVLFIEDRPASGFPCFTVNCDPNQGVYITAIPSACYGWGIDRQYLGPTTPNDPRGTYSPVGGSTLWTGVTFNSCSSPNDAGTVVVS